jgi:hypothetical protein
MAQRIRSVLVVAARLTVILCLAALSACDLPRTAPPVPGATSPVPGTPPVPGATRPVPGTPPVPSPTPRPSPHISPPSDPFGEVNNSMRRLVEDRATWQAPASLAVDRSSRIGLVIGDSGRLRTQIDDLVEAAVPRQAGPVKVGPKVRVALWSDATDAVVKPSEAVDQSTGSQIAMLWTWFVRPLHPSKGMFFIAHVEVPSGSHTFSTDISLRIPVHRTVSYTLHQVFTHWATWSAVAVTVASGARWLWKRRRGRQAVTQAVAADGSEDVSPPSNRQTGTA